jgi:hypothetical protein
MVRASLRSVHAFSLAYLNSRDHAFETFLSRFRSIGYDFRNIGPERR